VEGKTFRKIKSDTNNSGISEESIQQLIVCTMSHRVLHSNYLSYCEISGYCISEDVFSFLGFYMV